ncbi:MAG: dTDP-4-dehydrorhamnose reductase [Candidatus Bathyarchaeota archaeon]|nr:dTDP-4-dehydrorhamnose reductase [Candidatus Bathyarchaeota archaeon]
MKILVTGASGLLGHQIVAKALEKGFDVYSAYKENIASLGKLVKIDLTYQSLVWKTLAIIKPQVIIHAAAYTDVDGCEINKELAFKANAEATKHLAVAAAKFGAHLIYVSTDYVFNGEKGLYTEDEETNPINYYGYTKLKGEYYVEQYAKSWCIARPSVIYGWSHTRKLNFATWIINNLKNNREINVLVDQYVSPTFNTNLAEMLLEIAEKRINGKLHTAGASRVSRYEFALKCADTFNLRTDLIKPAKIEEMSWKAKRPRDSSLNVSNAEVVLDAKPLKLNYALETMKKQRDVEP